MEETHGCKDAARVDALAPILLIPHENPPRLPLAELDWKPTDTRSSGVCHFAVQGRVGEEQGIDQGVNV